MIDLASIDLVRAAPHIALHRGKTFVVKIGGEPLAQRAHRRAFAQQIAAVHALGSRIVLVHGGGPQTDSVQRVLGEEPRMIGGKRVTTPLALRALCMATAASWRLPGRPRRRRRAAAGLPGRARTARGVEAPAGRTDRARSTSARGPDRRVVPLRALGAGRLPVCRRPGATAPAGSSTSTRLHGGPRWRARSARRSRSSRARRDHGPGRPASLVWRSASEPRRARGRGQDPRRHVQGRRDPPRDRGRRRARARLGARIRALLVELSLPRRRHACHARARGRPRPRRGRLVIQPGTPGSSPALLSSFSSSPVHGAGWSPAPRRNLGSPWPT